MQIGTFCLALDNFQLNHAMFFHLLTFAVICLCGHCFGNCLQYMHKLTSQLHF
jgi:hypothetical protein